MKLINSENNKYIKLVKSLQLKKNREKNNMFFDEGIKNILLSLNSKYNIKFVLLKESFERENISDNDDILTKIQNKIGIDNMFLVSDKVFNLICDTVNTQGIIAVYDKPDFEEYYSQKNILILDRLQDPGNVGTIIRTAEAFGIDTIYYAKGTVDIFSPKVVRSSMGSIYFTKFHMLDDITLLKKNGYSICVSSLEGQTSLEFGDDKVALVVGNEANGISKQIIDVADNKIKIEMNGNAESLNVAIATGILIYEMVKRY